MPALSPAAFNIGVACTDAHLHTPRANQTAMIVVDERGDVQRATYAELAASSSRFAQTLAALDIAAGARIMIRLPNSLDYPTAFLGALKASAIAVPISPQLTGDELAYLAADAGASALVTDAASWADLAASWPPIPSLRHVLLTGAGAAALAAANDNRRVQVHALAELQANQADARPAPRTRPDDPAYLVYTSGTSGYPKGVLHAQRALLGHAPAWQAWFDFQGQERILHSGTFNWTYVLGTALMDPLYLGHTVIVSAGKADAARWPRLIATQRATIFIGVPTVYRQILARTACTAADVPTLRHCMCAGEHLSDDVLNGWRRRFGLDIYEAIGMSECSYYLSQGRAHPIRPGAVGFPQPGHVVKLLDADLREVAVGEEGMICIAEDDPGLFLRYWNQPEETARVRRGGWFLTGDYARQDAEGYFWFLGRKDDIIKSFGYRVSPFEVERVLKDHPAVADCAVVGEEVGPDKTVIAAHIVLAPDQSVSAAELMAFAAAHLARYKCPRLIYFVRDLPRTPNGKVLRRALQPVRGESGAG